MVYHELMMELLDKATTAVAEIGIKRDELKKLNAYSLPEQTRLMLEEAEVKDTMLTEFWELVIDLANIRWENLDLS